MNNTLVRFNLWDEAREEWRGFLAELSYAPTCGNGLHQFAPLRLSCACLAITIGEGRGDGPT